VTTHMFRDAYRGKRVLMTGHTGFKGSWLCEWLRQLGAEVTGFSDQVRPAPDLFRSLGLAEQIHHGTGDVRDAEAVRRAMDGAKPDFVFHLAAQPLVRVAYREPVATIATNVIGTVNVLEAARTLHRPVTMVMVTSDKCYENHESSRSYRETDELGGHDPYSASKSAAEIVIQSYRRSFFGEDSGISVASARAGNVIGGGDWASDRIVPDCMRSLMAGQPIIVRNPNATRPWQHVLEPVSGYLWLGASLATEPQNAKIRSAYNFGPRPESNKTVGQLVAEILQHWPGKWETGGATSGGHEAGLLSLNIDKAREQLGWQPTWSFEEAIAATTEWYRTVTEKRSSEAEMTLAQIKAYAESAQRADAAWAIA
jgi:CDP-glucose 4,6-dehydratase